MKFDTSSAVSSIRRRLRDAESRFLEGCYDYHRDGDQDEMLELTEYYLKQAFTEVLVLLDALGLQATYGRAAELFKRAEEDGISNSQMGPEEPYLTWAEELRRYVMAIEAVCPTSETREQETKELQGIIRRSVYALCNDEIYDSPPANENDVHVRIEAILKCYYPDLKRKPALTKSIKNFEPDTGIASLKTLIEYKFAKTTAQAKRIADEILADASGYRSRQWKNLLYVIYETKRLLPEDDWKRLLQECELHEGCDVIVLSGNAI